mgnify:CR=1 FL=1
MLVPIKIADQIASLPSSWHDVTMKQYCQIIKTAQEDLNAFRLVSILSGVPYSDLINIPADSFDSRVLDVLGFITESPLNVHELDRPETLTVGKRMFTIPDPGKCTVGQQLMLQGHCREAMETGAPHCDLVLYAAAVYLQPLIDGTAFNDERIQATISVIEQLPVIDIYPTGAFFLTGYIEFLKLSGTPSNQPQPTKNNEPEPMNSSGTSMSLT